MYIVHFGALGYYTEGDAEIEKIKNQFQILERKRKSYEIMEREIQSFFEFVAEIVSRHDGNIWNFDYMCGKLCSSVYDVLKSLPLDGKSYSVSYDTIIKRNSRKYVKLNGYSNTSSTSPSVYKKERALKENGHYDLKIFMKNNSEFVILPNREEVLKNFDIHNEESGKKYNQYIAMPVMDKDNNIVGLLQIIAFGDARLGINKEEIKSTIISYFRPFLSAFLLIYQINELLGNVNSGENYEKEKKKESL